MKTILMRTDKCSRWVGILVAAVVAIITSAVVANATQTITTPNAAKITFNLAPNTDSAAITPASNTSVLVMGCTTGANNIGVGHVSLLHLPQGGVFQNGIFEWVGLDRPGTITKGGSFMVGTHIVSIDFGGQVEIRIAGADTILVHNGSASSVTGNVTLIW
jgi:hypothetical protein